MPQRICLTRPGEFILEYRTVCRLRQLFFALFCTKGLYANNITFYGRDLKRQKIVK